MRPFTISMLILAFVMFSGACAGRQVRTGEFPAQRVAKSEASVQAQAVKAEAPVAALAETVLVAASASRPTVAEIRDAYVARKIADHNAAVRADGEKLLEASLPPKALANNGEIAAALNVEAGEHAARRASSAARQSRSKPTTALAVTDDGREAAVGSLIASASAVTQDVTAPAAPSILPAPQKAPIVSNAGPATDRAAPTLLIPDPSAVSESQMYWRRFLIGALGAVLFGLCCGLYATWRTRRRLRALDERPYDHLPDGTVILQEIRDGAVTTTQVVLPNLPEPRPGPEMREPNEVTDEIEQAWHADGDAMRDEYDIELPPALPVATADLFDPDAPFDPFDGLEKILAPDAPASDADPRFAAGSGLISSSDVLSVSGMTEAPDPPPETASKIETSAKVIYLDESSSEPDTPSASTSSN